MILFDTSVWINYLNKKDTPQVRILENLFAIRVRVYITPTIIQEVLQGISDQKRFDVTRRLLLAQQILQLDAVEIAIESANLYRSLRQKGVTIRKANDCLIAAYAIHFKVEICHQDSDFDLIAENSSLKITQFT
ncbi:PIN domain-containing protein [Arcicella sp. DC2W]|uniref:Ribonuclease VapC n=1 Tax=Arcicella gelida TaxID=2984195 RepID=A0ABU5SC70_9BACT|nr:PIN domain-containing protein [Arcicella sp. DC2W]MEA5406055.1 PIN domain-containing protein [Arcicella sp. DC2W]